MAERFGLGEPLSDPSNAKVDIVFVHGLGGDRLRTWTWEGDGRTVFWPKDLLPDVCKTARILSFGYNADFAHFYPFYGPKYIAEGLTVDDHSTSLFQSLVGLREKTKTSDRPVIFICHSLGGLVCANALSRSHGTDKASTALVVNTIGVAFLGTPFEGSSKTKWAKTALRMLDYISTTKKDDVHDLEERSAKLIQINDAFQKFLKARDRSPTGNHVEVACFFEQYAVYKFGKKVGVIVPKESACLPGIDPGSIQANHMDMCKFEDDDREGFRAVSQKVKQWIEGLDKRKTVGDSKNKWGSVNMGDVHFNEKIENNQGVVSGHIYSTAGDGVRITGSSTNNYYGYKPDSA